MTQYTGTVSYLVHSSQALVACGITADSHTVCRQNRLASSRDAAALDLGIRDAVQRLGKLANFPCLRKAEGCRQLGTMRREKEERAQSKKKKKQGPAADMCT